MGNNKKHVVMTAFDYEERGALTQGEGVLLHRGRGCSYTGGGVLLHRGRGGCSYTG